LPCSSTPPHIETRSASEGQTDKVDARILEQLLAADILPPVWLPDDRTRRCVGR
jgi:transposase